MLNSFLLSTTESGSLSRSPIPRRLCNCTHHSFGCIPLIFDNYFSNLMGMLDLGQTVVYLGSQHSLLSMRR